MLRTYFERKRIEAALKERIRFEDQIATMSTKFINLPLAEIDNHINEALQTMGQFVGIERSYVFRFTPDGTTMSCTHEWHADEYLAMIDHFQGIPLESIMARFSPNNRHWWKGHFYKRNATCSTPSRKC